MTKVTADECCVHPDARSCGSRGNWSDDPIIHRGSLGIVAEDREIERGYFLHLCDMVGLNGWDRNTSLDFENGAQICYFFLALHLHTKEFVPIFPNDDNRAKDGIELRKNFALYSSAFKDYSCLMDKPCSFLEMFAALALAIDTDIMCSPYDDFDRTQDWFWVMMHNLGFDKFNDACWDANSLEYVMKTLDNLNKRNIGKDGSGGIFPLRNPQSDQRTTEIWYQMQAFFLENYDELDLIGRKFSKPSDD